MTAAVLVISMIFTLALPIQKTGASIGNVSENFESNTAGAFICDKSGGVTIVEKSGNHYMKISPKVDGLTASAKYPMGTCAGAPIDIAFRFMLNDYVINGQTIADLSYGAISGIILKIEDNKLVYAVDGGGYVTVLEEPLANRWYNLKISADYHGKTFCVYIDGKEKVYNGKILGNATDADSISFSAKSAPGFSVDDFEIQTAVIPGGIKFVGTETLFAAYGAEAKTAFSVNVTDKQGNKLEGVYPSISLSPSDAGITYTYTDGKAEVTAAGDASEGEYTFCASYGGMVEYFRINLKRYTPEVKKIEVNGDSRIAYLKNVREKQTYKYTAMAYDQNGNKIEGASFYFSVTGDSIPSGILIDSTSGEITVTGELPKDVYITVNAELEGVYNVVGSKKVVLQDEETYWGDKRRFETLLDYIDRVREIGRDPWNGTPLIAMAIDRNTMKPATWRSDKKTYVPTNLTNQSNWFRALEGIYQMTGDEQYKKEIYDTYKFYIDNFQMDNGFLPWGGHMYLDMRDLSVVGEGIIEFKSSYPYMAPYWEIDPEGARKNAISLFKGSVTSWSTLILNRHISPSTPFSESEFNNYTTLAKPLDKSEYGLRWIQTGDIPFRAVANDLLFFMSDLHNHTKEEAAFKWSYRLLQQYFACTDQRTKIAVGTYTSRKGMVTNIPGERDDRVILDLRDDLLDQGYVNQWQYDNICIDPYYILSTKDIDNTYSDITLAKNYGVDTEEGSEILDYHLTSMASYAKYAYNPKNDTNSIILVDGTKVDGLVSVNTAGQYWTSRGAVKQPSKMSASHWLALVKTYIECNEYADKFGEQLNEIWKMIQNHARFNFMGEVGYSKPGDGVKVDCATDQDDPNYIIGLCMMYKETGEMQYIDLARKIADNIIKNKMVKGLFTHDTSSHYISLAGCVGEYVYGFALLEAMIRGEWDVMPEYFPSYEAIDNSGYKEDTGEFKEEIDVDAMWYNYKMTPVKINSIDIPQEEINMKTGEEKYLEISIEPDDATDTSLNIVSSDPGCVAFNYDDRSIKALRKGTAKVQIVVTDKRWIKKTLTVNVTE